MQWEPRFTDSKMVSLIAEDSFFSLFFTTLYSLSQIILAKLEYKKSNWIVRLTLYQGFLRLKETFFSLSQIILAKLEYEKSDWIVRLTLYQSLLRLKETFSKEIEVYMMGWARADLDIKIDVWREF